MAYDALDGYVVLFGGYVDAYAGSTPQTWIYSAGIWTELDPTTSPLARAENAMAYDAADHYLVMYGGYNFTAFPFHYFTDTWTFAGGNWTKIHPAKTPGNLSAPAMSYDANDSFVLLFGGLNSKGKFLNASWEFRAGAWTRLSPTTAPAPRSTVQMACDAIDGRVVLFGGYNNTTTFGDTWTFSGGQWRHLSLATAPAPRGAGAMAYSPMDRKVVLFGGVEISRANASYSGNYSDTWTFAHGVWSKVASAFHPSSRITLQMADGTLTAPMGLFGGSHYPYSLDLNDTWTYHASVWSRVLPHSPSARIASVLTYDEADGYVLLFGGYGRGGIALGDTWTFSNGVWTNLHPSVAPPPRAYAGMAYDQFDGYVVLFGGCCRSGTALGDTWTYLAGNWTQVLAGGPFGRYAASFAYDALDGYVLMFGGYNATRGYLGDTWSYSNGVWANETGGTAPSARDYAGMTYDSGDGSLLLFGGLSRMGGSNLVHRDTWTYAGGLWSNLTSGLTTSPTYLTIPALADDSTHSYTLLYGGELPNGSASNETWSFANGAWTLQRPASSPPALEACALSYDARDGYVILVGGLGNSGGVNSVTWTY